MSSVGFWRPILATDTAGYLAYGLGKGDAATYAAAGTAGFVSGLYKINTFPEALGALGGYMMAAAGDIFSEGPTDYKEALTKACIMVGGLLIGSIIPSQRLHNE